MQAQQHVVKQAGHMVTDGRKKCKGLVTPVLASAVPMNNNPKSIKELTFSPFPKPIRRLEDCKALIRACG